MSWLDLMHKHALTLGDIRKLAPGDSIEVVTFHRNFGDEMDSIADGVYDPLRLFAGMEKIDTYIHKHGVTGVFQFGWEEDCDDKDFSFDILYHDRKMWFPLSVDIHTLERVDPDKNAEKFPDDAFVGWSGYMITVDKLKTLPPFRYVTSGCEYRLLIADEDEE